MHVFLEKSYALCMFSILYYLLIKFRFGMFIIVKRKMFVNSHGLRNNKEMVKEKS